MTDRRLQCGPARPPGGQRGGALGVAALAALVSACGTAPLTPSVPQRLRVETPGCVAAQCTLSNDRGRWTVDPTPGDVEVMTSAQPLEVACRARDQTAGASIPPAPPREISAAGTVAGGAVGGGATAAVAAPLLATPYAPLVGVFALYGAIAGAGTARAIDAGSRTSAYPTPLVLPFRCDPVGIDTIALAGAPLGLAVRAVAAGEPQAGAIVSALAGKGRAARAGLQVGDAIVSVAGQSVDDPAALEAAVKRAPAAASLALGVIRAGAPVTITLPPRGGP